MKVRDVMTSQVSWVAPTATVVEAAKMMQREDVGSVPVCEQDRLLGIVTDRDIVMRAVATDKNLGTMAVQDIMSTQMVTVTPEMDVHEAAEMMSKRQIRRLPVIQGGKLVGIVALGDVAVEKIHVNEAGDALRDISQGVHH